MNKKDVALVKKQFGSELCNINQITTYYFNQQKEVFAKDIRPFWKYLETREEDKLLALFKKALTGKIGKNLFLLPIKEEKEMLDLRDGQLKDKESVYAFCDRAAAAYGEHGSENTILILINGEFLMTSGKEVKNEYVMGLFCPVTLSKPGLMMDKRTMCIKDREQTWVVEAPTEAFLYPAFTNGESDVHNLLYYMKKPENKQTELEEFLVGSTRPLSHKETKENVTRAMRDAFGSVPFELGVELQQTICGKVADEPDAALSPAEFALILKNSEYEEPEKFTEAYKEKLGDTPIAIEGLVDERSTTLVCGDVTIKVPNNKMHLIHSKEVDGRTCIVVFAEENRADVGGFEVKLK